MSQPLSIVVALAAAALLGSIPVGLLIARVWSGADVRRVGSGNIGATNVLRASGPLPAVLTLVLDIGKGIAAVVLARALVPAPEATADPGAAIGWGMPFADSFTPQRIGEWAGLAAVVGHVFTPWLRLRGGKGVATAAGVLLVLSPSLAGLGLLLFGIVIVLTRIVSLASILACAALPMLAAGPLHPRGVPSVLVVTAICALIIVRHSANIHRLLRGTEPRLGSGPRRGDGPPRGEE